VRGGEIDLVVRNGGVLVFCEVKTRTSDRFGTGLDAVTPAKQRRLRSLAGEWLHAHPDVRSTTVRFDVAALLVTTERTELRVVEHAF
jgi:putative endonuclease